MTTGLIAVAGIAAASLVLAIAVAGVGLLFAEGERAVEERRRRLQEAETDG